VPSIRRFAVLVALLWVAASARSEFYVPPPTLADLLGAQAAAIGHFAIEEGKLRFVAKQVLWGDAGAFEGVALSSRPALPFGAPETRAPAVAVWSAYFVAFEDVADPTRTAVWIRSRSKESEFLSHLPVELAAGLRALKRGEPCSDLFRLLQPLDFDMARAALERLFVDRDAERIEALHRIALDPDSPSAPAAIEALVRTRTIDARRFWGRWAGSADPWRVSELLRTLDPERFRAEVRASVTAAKSADRLARVLPYARDDLDLSLKYLAHESAHVRAAATGNVWNWFSQGSRDPEESRARARELLPRLRERADAESFEGVRGQLVALLAEEGGVPWILRDHRPARRAPYRYSDADEWRFAISVLKGTSPGETFARDSAGRELARYDLPGLAGDRLFEDLGDDALGHVHHPAAVAYLLKRVEALGAREVAGGELVRALVNQEDPRCLAALGRLLDRAVTGGADVDIGALCESLARKKSPTAHALLEAHGARLKQAGRTYLTACAAHGDEAALAELMRDLGGSDPLEAEFAVGSVLVSDSPAALDAIRRHVRTTWPSRWGSRDGLLWGSIAFDPELYMGDRRRTTPLGEWARRDPGGLAQFALEQMGSDKLLARAHAIHVFTALTGRSFGFLAWAFEPERAPALKKARAWWAQHRDESRERWLLSLFREAGFELESLEGADSLPALARALGADALVHDVALEQITAITGKYFGCYRQQTFYLDEGCSMSVGYGGMGAEDRDHVTRRVRGWLRARGLLPEPTR